MPPAASPALWNVAHEAVSRRHAQQRVSELAAALTAAAAAGAPCGRLRIAEIGAGAGGTLYCWAQLGALVWAVTEPVPGPEHVHSYGARLLFADSHDPAARHWLETELAGCLLDVLFIDGDHSLAGARADWDDYHPLVRPGGLVLIHDVLYHGCTGPAQLWAELGHDPPGAMSLIGDPAGPRPCGFGVIVKEQL